MLSKKEDGNEKMREIMGKWLRRREEKIYKACKKCQPKEIIEACERCVDERKNGDIIGGGVGGMMGSTNEGGGGMIRSSKEGGGGMIGSTNE